MLLSNFSSDTENYFGFYNSYYGESPNTVNGLALCRGDTQLHACQNCIKNATTLLPKLCPNQKEVFLYYDLCILRYSNVSILGMYQNPEFSYAIHSPEKAKDAKKYRDALDDLMMRLKSKASSGDSLSKVAVGNVTADENESVYGLVQCTPDLTQQDCDDCLVKAISEIQGCCKDKIGGRVIKLSCNLRFDNVMFYDPAVVEPIQSPSAILATAPSPGPIYTVFNLNQLILSNFTLYFVS
ncbi:cysteine-rich receptor-like protein kinase 26 [Neltuma alba]|uniref:cysteine-rich receptor-like protein kinase 26 n=1 Tax=Neltuma alba TaxID=207710 RepID=UPI0010A47817|nr:cysteine-rich receptor-like protein kinase 26 [Prosopis alba]